MTPQELKSVLEKHKLWLEGNPSGEYADLSDADLRRANLDFSCLPLWCGSLSAHFDDKQIIQIIYHAVKAGLNSKNASDSVKEELKKLINLANQFHRVHECGRIEEVEQNENKGETNHEQNN